MDRFKLLLVAATSLPFVLVFVFDLIWDIILVLRKQHIAQKHPGVNECSEQDPGGADGP